MVRAFAFQVCCPKRALNGKPVRSSEQSRRCPRNGNRPRSPGIAVRSNATVPRHGKASAMRVESPETGLSGFDWCCGGQHRQARLPVSRIPRLFLPSSKVLRSFEDLLPMKLSRLALAIALTPGLALAQTSSREDALKLSDTLITANRDVQQRSATTVANTVFTRSDIERLQPTSVLDLLQRAPGVQVTQSGGRGSLSSLFIRGTKTAQNVVLVDGQRIADVSTGGHFLEWLSIDQIERVEILRGPRSTLYGAD